MKRKKKRRPGSRPPCGRVGSDDGIDPRSYFREEGNESQASRKTLQLCAQAKRALQMALAGLGDERLASIEVVRVEPAPDATRLKAILRSLDPNASASEVLMPLERAHGLLRQAVADGIRRRKAPDLVLLLEQDDPADDTP